MKEIIVVESEPQITNSDIENAEVTLKLKLPKEYKSFLLKHNGGHPIKDMYPIIEVFDFHRYGWGTSSVYDCGISWFYAIYDGEYNNFIKENRCKENPMQDDFVIIGCNSGGDEICIGIKENNFGKVYYWGHDWEISEESLSFVLIANNFTDFINSLYQSNIQHDGKGNTLYVDIHDYDSLPLSQASRKYGDTVTNFFSKAPISTEDFVIERPDQTEDIILYYDDKEKGIRPKRIIKSDSSYADSEEKI